MTKIDIFSGFLGAGKTTLIKKLIKEAYAGEKLVLIENEFGEIGIDGGFLKEAGIQITEMNSGCICCSLVGDFGKALEKVMQQFAPDRILIEPSGVGKLSDVIRAVQGLNMADVRLNSFTTVVDATKCKMYMKNFGEFFNNQVEFANSIVLSRTDGLSEEKLAACVSLLRTHNEQATIITTPWDQLNGKQILDSMEHKSTLDAELAHLAEEARRDHDDDECDDPECECHHHHDHEDEAEHEHHHHHDHDDDECDDPECECHHHHDHDDEAEHEHHHHHDHDDDECDDPECECHHHHEHEDEAEHEHHHHHHDDEEHAHHHHHHADEIFTSWGVETTRIYTSEELHTFLAQLDDETKYGAVLRAKGIVAGADGQWIHFDYVPGESNVRFGGADVTGRLCVIGSKLNEAALRTLFHV